MALVIGTKNDVSLSLEIDSDYPTIFATKDGEKIEIAYFNEDGKLFLQALTDTEQETLDSELSFTEDGEIFIG